MKLPIRVVITSSVPERTRSSPGHSAQTPPPAMPAAKASGTTSAAGSPRRPSATKVAAMAPI